MQDFKGKVAVVTGAASGIGYALAERCVREGMRVVLADIETRALKKAEKQLRKAGGEVRAVRTDVSKLKDIETLAVKGVEAFGGVHMLFNNAGISGGGSGWNSSLADWEWTLGVNLWSVIYGLKTFVPIMRRQDTACHIVNTASLAGHVTQPGMAPYAVSKFGVVALSECLYGELTLEKSKIGVSVLCPAWVNTAILDSERNRPRRFQNTPQEAKVTDQAFLARMRDVLKAGLSPEAIADAVFAAVEAEKFYILTHPDFNPIIQKRMHNILEGVNPFSA